MPYNVNPTTERPTHDLLLTNSTGGQVGLILSDVNGNPDPFQWTYGPMPATGVKTYQGSQGYADTPPPWTPEVQSDWSGGRGSKDYDKDTSKYADNYRTNTTREGEIICGPWDFYAKLNNTSGVANWAGYWEGEKGYCSARTMVPLLAATSPVADSFVATGTTGFIWLILQYTGTPTDITITILDNDGAGGDPGTVLETTTYARTNMVRYPGPRVVRIPITEALTPGDTYWMQLSHAGSASYWSFGQATDTAQTFKRWTEAGGGSWLTVTNSAIFFRVCQAEDQFKAHFASYKGNVFAALEYDDGGSSRLFINGDQGAATSGSVTTLLDTGGTNWVDDEWNNAIVTLNEGAGSGQPTNWALITDTDGTAESVTFAAMDVAPAAQTLYSIVGSPKFREIDTTGATPNWDASTSGFVTDVLSVNHGMLFAKGDSLDTWRYRAYNSAGTWTTEWVDETECLFTYLMDATDEDGSYIWGAKGGYPSKIYYAESKDWSGTGASATVLDFVSTGVTVGDVGERITSLIRYGEYGNLHVHKEGSIYQLVSKIPYQLGLAQYGNARDRRNGVATTAHNVYMYYSYHNTVMRYFNGQADNVGPTRDSEGLPADRLGPIVDMVGYENNLYFAVDGGDSNYSCILAYNQLGLCEIYRPPAVGLRIRSLFVEPLPGDNVDRLWFSCGSDVGWLTLASDPYNYPVNNNYHHYSFGLDGGYVDLSYMYFNQQDVKKLFNTIRFLVEQANGSSYLVYVNYRLDDATSWTPLSLYVSDYDITNSLDTALSDNKLSSTYSVTGRRIQFKIRPVTFDPTSSPRITTIIAEALIQQTFKYYLDITFRMADKDVDLQEGYDDVTTALAKYTELLARASDPTGVLVRTRHGITDNKYYKVDPLSLKIVNKVTRENRSYHVARCRLYQLS